MRARRLVALAVAVMLVAGCAGGTASGAPVRSVASGAVPSSGGPPAPSTGVPVVGLEGLAERDERVIDEGLRASGALERMGPDVAAWLETERHAFVAKSLGLGGVEALETAVASTDAQPRLAAGVQGGFGTVLTGAFVRELGRRGSAEGGDISLEHTEPSEGTFGGSRASIQMTVSVDVHQAGSRLEGTVAISMVVTLLDADGNATGTVTIAMTSEVDVDVCPDIDGAVNAHFSSEIEVDSSASGGAGAGSYRLTTQGVSSGSVGDDAFLHGLRVTGESARTGANADSSASDTAVELDVRYGLGTAGDVGSLAPDGANDSASGDVVRSNEQTTDAEVTALYTEVAGLGVTVASLLFEAAQAKWRTGTCVRIEATEASRTVEPDEVVPFTATPHHEFDGIRLDDPIKATFAGKASATPLDEEQEPPAAVTFTAGPDEGDRGTVGLTSTSKRGIGMLELVFTVAEAFELELLIESEISVTKLNALETSGTTKASGTIRLTKGASGTWSGTGTLTSETRVGDNGCNSVMVRGTGTYDWVVREARVEPGQPIELWMDAGTIQEQPDTATLRACPGASITGQVNTWENLFFVAHNRDYQSFGFHVTGWNALASEWVAGQSFAHVIWFEDCSGPSAATRADRIVGCTGTTTLYLAKVDPGP